ncbi:MAG: CDP-alcohol phosphatidyltransferase family protein [bacterium]
MTAEIVQKKWWLKQPKFFLIRQTSGFKKVVKYCAVLPANFWSGLRLLGAPVVIWLLTIKPIYGLIAYVLFALTDSVDGPVATYRNEVGQGGAFLDATVDKLFVLPIMWYIGLYDQTIMVPWLFWYMVAIELGGRVFLGVYWRLRQWPFDFHSNRWGKLKLGWQCALLASLFFSYFLNWPWYTITYVVLIFINILATLSVVVHMQAPKSQVA